ncbi:hypothetical protein CEXT_163421 [Caerostris extrusa]|uniref:Uncharacterized protein n=1 Tax=Caerostris extrusa TaxID=172846 RepID=A0AAV4V2B7_CAEEX|nr:hypothetical protein CEXT_163421 [Caerostris extrusa]
MKTSEFENFRPFHPKADQKENVIPLPPSTPSVPFHHPLPLTLPIQSFFFPLLEKIDGLNTVHSFLWSSTTATGGRCASGPLKDPSPSFN